MNGAVPVGLWSSEYSAFTTKPVPPISASSASLRSSERTAPRATVLLLPCDLVEGVSQLCHETFADCFDGLHDDRELAVSLGLQPDPVIHTMGEDNLFVC